MREDVKVLINFKPYQDYESVNDCLNNFSKISKYKSSNIYLALPYTFLARTESQFPAGTHLGANEMVSIKPGCFTEKAAIQMLTDAKAEFVLLGTKEEKAIHNENKQSIQQKAKAALQVGLKPIIAIDASLEKPDLELLKQELQECLGEFSDEDRGKLWLLYQVTDYFSVKRFAKKDIDRALDNARAALNELWGSEVSKALPILFSIPLRNSNLLRLCFNCNLEGICIPGPMLTLYKHAMVRKIASPKKSRAERDVKRSKEEPQESPAKSSQEVVKDGEIKTEVNAFAESQEATEKNLEVAEEISQEAAAAPEELTISSQDTDGSKTTAAPEEKGTEAYSLANGLKLVQETVDRCSDLLAEAYFENTYIPKQGEMVVPEQKMESLKSDFKKMFALHKKMTAAGLQLMFAELQKAQDPRLDEILNSIDLSANKSEKIASLKDTAVKLEENAEVPAYRMIGMTDESMGTLYDSASSIYVQDRFSDAASAFYTMISLNGSEYVHWLAYGIAKKLARNDFRSAVEAFAVASKLNVSSPEPYVHSTECHLELGDIEGARKQLEAATALLSEDDEEHALLRRWCAELKIMIKKGGMR